MKTPQPITKTTPALLPGTAALLSAAMERVQAALAARKRISTLIAETEASLLSREAELEDARKQPEANRVRLTQLRDDIQNLDDVLAGLHARKIDVDDALIADAAAARGAHNAFANETVEAATVKFEGLLHGVILESLREFYVTCSAVGVEKFGFSKLSIPDPRNPSRHFGVTEAQHRSGGWQSVLPRLKDANAQAAIDAISTTHFELKTAERQADAISAARSRALADEQFRQKLAS